MYSMFSMPFSVILRNLCAHESRLYNRLFEQKPSLSRAELNCAVKADNTVDNSHL